MVRPDDVPDDDSTSDHRPVLASFDTDAASDRRRAPRPELVARTFGEIVRPMDRLTGAIATLSQPDGAVSSVKSRPALTDRSIKDINARLTSLEEQLAEIKALLLQRK